MTRDKRSWKRVPNTGPGRRVGNKYNFTQVLKHVGDFVETHSFPTKRDMMKIVYAAHIWAFRHKYRIKTWYIYYPDGYGCGVERIQ